MNLGSGPFHPNCSLTLSMQKETGGGKRGGRLDGPSLSVTEKFRRYLA